MAITASAAVDRRTRAARGALWLSLGSWTAKGIQTVLLVVLARFLAPSEFGILAIAALTYNILQAINSLGITDALTYLDDRVEEAAGTALSLVLALGLVLTGVTWGLAPFLASFFHSPQATFVLRGFALTIPFDAAATVPIARLTRALDFRRRTVTDTVPSVIGGAVTIAVVVAGHPLGGLVAGQVTAGVFNLATALLIGPRCLPHWDTGLARKMLGYGGYLCAANIVNLALLNVDYIVVGHVLGPVPLGLYSLAYRICYMPYLSIAYVVNGAAFPYYCRLPTREAVARAAENVFALVNAVSVVWFAGLVLFAGDITLLGHKWAPAVGAVRLLAVYGLFLAIAFTALQPLKAAGRSGLVLAPQVMHLVVLTAVLVGTATEGIAVVALDQAAVAGAVALLTCLWCVRHASLRPAALTRATALPLVGALGMIALVAALRLLAGLRIAPSWTVLLTLGPAAVVVYVAILLLIMPDILRQGWASLRGRQGEATTT